MTYGYELFLNLLDYSLSLDEKKNAITHTKKKTNHETQPGLINILMASAGNRKNQRRLEGPSLCLGSSLTSP